MARMRNKGYSSLCVCVSMCVPSKYEEGLLTSKQEYELVSYKTIIVVRTFSL